MTTGFHRQQFAELNRKIIFGLAAWYSIAAVLMATATVIKPPPETRRKMDLTSSAFKEGQPIPNKYACDGTISPPLTWTGAPDGTQSFALIVDDPDSPNGVWTHWVVFDLPADAQGLAEDFVNSPAAGSAKQGVNSFKKVGYGGPCPPADKLHRYFFKLYALDTTLNLQAGASRQAVEAAMAKHIVAIGQLMGTYERK